MSHHFFWPLADHEQGKILQAFVNNHRPKSKSKHSRQPRQGEFTKFLILQEIYQL